MTIKEFLALLVLFSLVILSPLFVRGQNGMHDLEEIHVRVNGDTVILSQDTVNRNCGAIFDMRVLLLSDTLYWYQVDTGNVALCMCTYNLK